MESIHVEHRGQTSEGGERLLRGTTREGQGPARWRRNVSLALRLTSSTASPVIAPRAVALTPAPGAVCCVCPHSTAGDARMIRARESGAL